MKTYLVQIDTHDDMITARDKISWSKARRVLLVYPRAGRVLERRADLLLLLRHCQQLGAQMAVVTGSGEVRANARELGIPVFRSSAQAQQKPWRSLTRTNWNDARRESAVRRQAEGSLRDLRSVLRTVPELPVWQRLAWFAAGLMACAGLLALLVPSAKVEVALRRQPQSMVVAGWADPWLAAPNTAGGIPASEVTVTVEGRAEAFVKGKSLAPDTFAEGLVTIANRSGQDVVVPADSIVMALGDDILRYRTTRAAQLVVGAEQRVPVRAEVPGRAGNAAAGAINTLEGPLGFSVQVRNVEPLRGGTDRSAPVPSRTEVETLRAALLEDLRKNALDELVVQVGDGRQVLADTLQVDAVLEEAVDPPAGEPGRRLQISLRVTFRALAVSTGDWEAVARSALDASVPDGWRADPASLQLEPLVVESSSEGPARWEARAVRALEPVWDAESARVSLPGRSLEDAAQFLREAAPVEGPPVITTFPAWWGRMPLLPFRIQVVAR